MLTADGWARPELAGFMLLSSSLTPSRCAELDALHAAADEGALRRELARELEAVWPRERFSSAVNTAKRAILNRIGTDVVHLCGG